MISYANAKINIGLNVTARREDGYHLLETVFVPFPCYDILEITDKKDGGRMTLEITGIDLIPDDNNLCLKAYRLLSERFSLPSVHIHLHKQIPFGAGLGGGSSDAAAVLKMLNEKFGIGLSFTELELEASKLGADCPFFVHNKPMFATGIGTNLSPITLDLTGKYIVLIKPGVHVSTAEAYRGITPKVPSEPLTDLIQLPVQNWKYYIKNDFEEHIFEMYPAVREAKLALYAKGALYAAMSGSGSAVYGIFSEEINLDDLKHLGTVIYPTSL